MMTVMEYVAKFTKFARFADDYVATDMAKVRRFENGLKLSIWDKIVGLRKGHSGCECRWEEEGGLAFFEFRKETEDLCPRVP